jgi:hypothetical protein
LIVCCKQEAKRLRGKIQEFLRDLLFSAFDGKDGSAPQQYAQTITEEVEPVM